MVGRGPILLSTIFLYPNHIPDVSIGEVNLADLVFIDEAGVNIAMTRRFARSPQGSRAYGDCPDGRGKNVTMIGAMSTEGIICHDFYWRY
jgi:hypothetical protein